MERAPTTMRLLTDKSDLGRTVVDASTRRQPLVLGEAALALETFAITANNITYAAYGDAMHYWDFFPTGCDGLGHMPVWGFATVAESRVGDLEVGTRLYGYFPIADELIVRPSHVSERGFFDAAPHRSALPTPYNQYTCATEALGYSAEWADYQMLIRPLFFTSWMLADFLVDNDCFGAQQIVLSSASSKTAYGCAFALKPVSNVTLVAITSAANRDYVEQLGLYDEICTYEYFGHIAKDRSTVYLDFSGRGDLALQLHEHLGKTLIHHAAVGSAATTNTRSVAHTLEPRPTLFFAPDQIRKRTEDWGSDTLYARYSAAEMTFVEKLANPDNPWLAIQSHHGFDEAARVIRDIHDHGSDAKMGHVVRLG